MRKWDAEAGRNTRVSVDTDGDHIATIGEIRLSIQDTMMALAAAEKRLSNLSSSLLASRVDVPTPQKDLPSEPKPQVQSELVSIADLIKELRISRSTIYKLKNRKDFPQSIAVSTRRTLFRRSEIWEWLETHRQ